jgi:hypothetical protein
VKGASAVLTSVLLVLVAIVMSAAFFGYLNRLRAGVASAGEQQMVSLEIPPKLMSLVCYDGYGYMLLSLSQGQGAVNGSGYFTVEKDTGELMAEDFLNLSLSGSTKVFIPYAFNTSERYKVTLAGKQWRLSEYCTPFNDPHMVLHLALDEASGTTAQDSSGNDNDAEVINASWVVGVSGNALDFDGAGDYADLGNKPAFNLSSAFTVATWVRFSAFGDRTIVAKGYDGSLVQYNFRYLWGDFCFTTWDGSSNYGSCTSSNWSTGTWYFLVGSYDGTWHTYVNGLEDSNEMNDIGATPKYNGRDTYLGALDNNGTPAYFLNGTLDDVRIYSRALSAAEVSALYDAYSG